MDSTSTTRNLPESGIVKANMSTALTALQASQSPVVKDIQTPLDNYMVAVTEQDGPQDVLVCFDMLSPDKKREADKIARTDFQRIRSDSVATLNYGISALEDLNKLIDRIFKDMGHIEIPELTALIRDMNSKMNKIQSKYDMPESKLSERIESWNSKMGGLIRMGKSFIQTLMDDAKSIQQLMDKAQDRLLQHEQKIQKNVTLSDQLYKENEKDIWKVIFAISTMERIVEYAGNELKEIKVDTTDPRYHEQLQKQSELSDFISRMQVKIAEFKGRLIIGWTTSPQLINMRSVQIGLVDKLHVMRYTTFAAMKLSIIQWMTIAEAAEAAKMGQEVTAATNNVLVTLARNSKQAIPAITEFIQRPTLLASTIVEIAESLKTQSEQIAAAYDQGQQLRTELDSTIMEAKREVSASQGQLNQHVVESFIQKAKSPLLLEGSQE